MEEMKDKLVASKELDCDLLLIFGALWVPVYVLFLVLSVGVFTAIFAQTPVCAPDNSSKRAVELIHTRGAESLQVVDCRHDDKTQPKVEFTVDYRSERRREKTSREESDERRSAEHKANLLNGGARIIRRTPGYYTTDRWSGGTLDNGIQIEVNHQHDVWVRPRKPPVPQIRVVNMYLTRTDGSTVKETAYFQVDQNDSMIIARGYDPKKLESYYSEIGKDPEGELRYEAFKFLGEQVLVRKKLKPASEPVITGRPRRVVIR